VDGGNGGMQLTAARSIGVRLARLECRPRPRGVADMTDAELQECLRQGIEEAGGLEAIRAEIPPEQVEIYEDITRAVIYSYLGRAYRSGLFQNDSGLAQGHAGRLDTDSRCSRRCARLGRPGAAP
jgi:hypothetical protein